MLDRNTHPSDEQILLELDGELSASAAKSVRTHLEACWPCRARRQQLERSIADLIRASESDGLLPSAASARERLQARMAELKTLAPERSPRPATQPSRMLHHLAACVLCLLAISWLASRFGFRPRWQHPRTTVLSMPDANLTPGATILLSQNAVCSQANVKNKDVPPSVQRIVFGEYGIEPAQLRSYEVDYLVTPALGGSDDIRNLWPHSYSSTWNARVKDALEDRLREMVCEGKLELSQAQREIATNWIEAYKKYFQTDVPLTEHAKEWH
ncbi:MAG TPA: hypothetical protein VKU19_18160 [Bryobacteraceae bacterium]|nr:hypothetical protein [Bryobacteraceae bacterium]